MSLEAFPRPMVIAHRLDGHISTEDEGTEGMSMLDYFAGQALIGILVGGSILGKVDNDAKTAAWCYDLAAAMIRERKRAV